MPVPDTMIFVTADGAGDPGVLKPATGPVPVPKADEVLIRVLAAGVNRPDVQQRKGLYPPPPGASPILGLEVAGEVVARGAAVTAAALGDRVCALTNGGGYAEYAVAPATQCLPWPADFDAVRAAALPETFFTVWANVFMLGRLGRGETLLVHGGTSGIGITAIQLAVAFGSDVYATAGSAEKCAACERLGAAAAINYREADFGPEIKRLTDGRGVDVVLDMVGAPYTLRNIRALAMDGRLVQIAFLEGAKVDGFDLTPIMTRRLTVTGSTMRPRTTAQKAEIARELREKVWPVLEHGRCAPVIHAVFPLAEAAAAHALMESSAHIGKIMLSVGGLISVRNTASPRAGLVQLAISVVLLSSAFPATKLAMSFGAAPLWFAFGRAGFACLTACAALALTGRMRFPTRADLPAVLSVGLLQLAAFFALSHVALLYVPAGRSSILSNATTVWVAPLTVLVLRENVSPRRWLGAGFGLLGTLVLIGPWSIDWAAPGVLLGHVFLLMAALGFAIAMIVVRRFPPRTGMLELLPWCFVIATIVLALVAMADGGAVGTWPAAVWTAMAYIGLVAGPFGTLCVMLAAASLPAMVSSVGFLATPAIGLLLSTLFLGEPVGIDLIAGSVLILGGVALAAWPARRPVPA